MELVLTYDCAECGKGLENRVHPVGYSQVNNELKYPIESIHKIQFYCPDCKVTYGIAEPDIFDLDE